MRPVVALLAGLWLAAPAAAQLTSTVILKTGDAAPGTPAGVTFSSFGVPTVNTSSQVLVFGVLQGSGVFSGTNNTGLWVGARGALELAARQGTGVPPGSQSGQPFNQFSKWGLSETGRVNFYATLQGAIFPNDHGAWTYGAGTLDLLGRSGQQVPGQPTGTTFGQFLDGPKTNAAGAAALDTNVQVNGVNQPSAIWIGTPAGFTPYLRPGTTPAPGMPAGATFNFTQLDNFNAAGQLAFYGRAAGGGLTSSNDEGIWAGPPDNLTLVAHEGSPMPNGPAGGNLFSFYPPQFNDQGQLLIRGSMTGIDPAKNNALWFGTPTNMTVIAQRGTQAAGMPNGVLYGDLMASTTRTQFANGGAVMLKASVTGTGVTTSNDQALWVGTAGNLSLALRKGDPVPGATGLNFGDFDANYDPALSSLGLAAVLVKLTGNGVTTSNDEALWVAGPGMLTQVARKGDVIDLGPGSGTKTISGLALDFDGFKGPYLTWEATFTDGTQALFLTPVPEPAGVLLAVAGAGLAGTILRRRRTARPS
jgi:hypothetical protein